MGKESKEIIDPIRPQTREVFEGPDQQFHLDNYRNGVFGVGPGMDDKHQNYLMTASLAISLSKLRQEGTLDITQVILIPALPTSISSIFAAPGIVGAIILTEPKG